MSSHEESDPDMIEEYDSDYETSGEHPHYAICPPAGRPWEDLSSDEDMQLVDVQIEVVGSSSAPIQPMPVIVEPLSPVGVIADEELPVAIEGDDTLIDTDDGLLDPEELGGYESDDEEYPEVQPDQAEVEQVPPQVAAPFEQGADDMVVPESPALPPVVLDDQLMLDGEASDEDRWYVIGYADPIDGTVIQGADPEAPIVDERMHLQEQVDDLQIELHAAQGRIEQERARGDHYHQLAAEYGQLHLQSAARADHYEAAFLDASASAHHLQHIVQDAPLAWDQRLTHIFEIIATHFAHTQVTLGEHHAAGTLTADEIWRITFSGARDCMRAMADLPPP